MEDKSIKVLKSESQRQNLRINLRWKEMDYSSIAEKKFSPYTRKCASSSRTNNN